MGASPYHHLSKSRWVAITAIMSALALVGNYVLVIVPNVELGSGILFVTSFLFGLEMAVWCVLVVSIIYAFINPWGPFFPAIWFTQLIGWMFLVVAGAIIGRNWRNISWSKNQILEIAGIGLITTLFFDLITTAGYAWTFSVPYAIAIMTGLPFIVMHVLSNIMIFPAIVPSLDKSMRHQFAAFYDDQEDEG